MADDSDGNEGFFGRQISRAVDREYAIEEEGPTPQRWRRTHWTFLIGMVAVFGQFATVWFDGWWAALVSWPCGAVVGWLVVRGAWTYFNRAKAYQRGWLEGRTALLNSVKEAADRGIAPEEWLLSELQRDFHRMTRFYSMAQEPSITCPKCFLTSYSTSDIAEGYCGNCHDWTTPVPPVIQVHTAQEVVDELRKELPAKHEG